MFGSTTLEIAIGLAFVYLLFSLVCTTLTECIGRLLRLRASTLKSAIANMIVGENDAGVTEARPPKTTNALQKEYVDKGLYQHGLIQSLAKSSGYDRLIGGKRLDKGRPSYIPAHIFAIALLDSIVNKPATTATSAATVTTATAATPYFERLNAAIETLPTGLPVRAVLQSFVELAHSKTTSGESNLATVQKQVEEWFNDVMERTSGWYTRKTAGIVFWLAVVITLAFNIDTLALANALARDATLRTTVVNAADKFLVANPPSQSDTQPSAQPSNLITSTVTSTTTSNIAASPAITLTLSELEKEIDGLGLPLGWVRMQSSAITPTLATRFLPDLATFFVTDIITETKAVTVTAKAKAQYEQAKANRQTWPEGGGDWGKKLAGFFLTIVALSLGAPFWFDLLNNLVNLRSTGKPPKESNPPAQVTVRTGGSGW